MVYRACVSRIGTPALQLALLLTLVLPAKAPDAVASVVVLDVNGK